MGYLIESDLMCVISKNAKIGEGSIIKFGSIIEDDCVIGDNCVIGPYAVPLPNLSTNFYPIFPASKLGNINTFASPATLEPGAFNLATFLSNAASN